MSFFLYLMADSIENGASLRNRFAIKFLIVQEEYILYTPRYSILFAPCQTGIWSIGGDEQKLRKWNLNGSLVCGCFHGVVSSRHTNDEEFVFVPVENSAQPCSKFEIPAEPLPSPPANLFPLLLPPHSLFSSFHCSVLDQLYQTIRIRSRRDKTRGDEK